MVVKARTFASAVLFPMSTANHPREYQLNNVSGTCTTPQVASTLMRFRMKAHTIGFVFDAFLHFRCI